MAEITREQALREWASVQEAIQTGAYQEREPDGSYGADGIEESADRLEIWAACRGLQFAWRNEDQEWRLEPIEDAQLLAFLKVNVEALRDILSETTRYLTSFAYISNLERAAREGLLERVAQVLRDTYRVPVLIEDAEQEAPPDSVEHYRRAKVAIQEHDRKHPFVGTPWWKEGSKQFADGFTETSELHRQPESEG